MNKLFAPLTAVPLCLLVGCALPNLQPMADATATVHLAVLETDVALQQELEAFDRLAAVLAEAAEEAAEQAAAEEAVANGGSLESTVTVSASLVDDSSEDGLDEDESSEDGEYSTKFTEAWRPRVRAMEALVAYSNSLAEVSAAAGAFGENVDNVASSLEGLLGAFDPARTIDLGGKTLEIAKVGVELIAIVQARNDLKAAVVAADPAIQQIALILIADFDSLHEGIFHPDELPLTFEAIMEQQFQAETGLDRSYAIDMSKLATKARKDVQDATRKETAHIITYEAQRRHSQLEAAQARHAAILKEQELRLARLIDSSQAELDKLQGELDDLNKALAERVAMTADYKTFMDDSRAVIKDLEKYLGEIEALSRSAQAAFEPLDKQLADMRDRFQKHDQLVLRARDYVASWARVHGRLAANLENGAAPNFNLLLGKATRIQAILAEESE